MFVPESKRLNVLLREFRANRNHIAIVVDEYGGVSGLVTIEDVLEQIVGDIEDEYDFDESEDNIIPEAGGRFRVKAQTEIEDFNAQFGTTYDERGVRHRGRPACCRRSDGCPSAAKRRRSAGSASACCAPTAVGCTRCRSRESRRYPSMTTARRSRSRLTRAR